MFQPRLSSSDSTHVFKIANRVFCIADILLEPTVIIVPLLVIDCTFLIGATALSGPGPQHSRGFQTTHNDELHSVELLWMSDRPIAETSTLQHTTFTTDKHSCLQWGLNS